MPALLFGGHGKHRGHGPLLRRAPADVACAGIGRKANGPRERPVPEVGGCPVAGTARSYSLASLRRASARSVFSQEKAVAVCFLPAPST